MFDDNFDEEYVNKAVKEENKKNYRRCGEQVRGAAEMPTICAARSPLTLWRTIWLPPPSGRTTTRSSLRYIAPLAQGVFLSAPKCLHCPPPPPKSS